MFAGVAEAGGICQTCPRYIFGAPQVANLDDRLCVFPSKSKSMWGVNIHHDEYVETHEYIVMASVVSLR